MSGFPSPGIARGGKTRKIQEFKSSGVWPWPAGVEVVDVLLVGGGASGEASLSSSNAYSAGGGGAGGSVVEKLISVSSDLAITIPSGGAGSSAGGDASITGTGVNVIAYGGKSANSDYSNRSGGSISAASNTCRGGPGAGAGGSAWFEDRYQASASVYEKLQVLSGKGHGGLGGSTISPSIYGAAMAGKDIKGFGGGGGGGGGGGVVILAGAGAGAPAGASSIGEDAIANTGSGGGGGNTHNQASTSYAGGNGGSGYALITWFE